MSPSAPREYPEIIDREPPGVLKKIGRHLNKHKGKYLLAALAAYGLGAVGQAGLLHQGGRIASRVPAWAQPVVQGARYVSAQATRFNHVVDPVLQRAFPSAGFQTPTNANSASQIRTNIRQGSGPTKPHEIS